MPGIAVASAAAGTIAVRHLPERLEEGGEVTPLVAERLCATTGGSVVVRCFWRLAGVAEQAVTATA